MKAKLEIAYLPIGDLKPNPKNPRRNERTVAAVKASIEAYGFRNPIVVRRQDMVIEAGHTRLMAAKELGFTEVPCILVDDADSQAIGFMIADNKVGETSEWDNAQLIELLEALESEEVFTGYTKKEYSKLTSQLRREEAAALAAESPPVDITVEPISKTGDLWLLGKHRLLCGDSTNEADMARLMNGETAVLMATDPTYLVDYDGTNHPNEHHVHAGRTKKADGQEVGKKHWDAYIDPKTGVEFFRRFLEVALQHCAPCAPIYQWHASRRQALVQEAWEKNDLLLHQAIVWVKSRGVLTRSHFLWKSEPCFYGWRSGNQPEQDRRPPSDQTNVWEIPNESEGIHPTQKPLLVFAWPIAWHSFPGEVVLEPFSGSGTQIIAAENAERRCFAMEQSPAFVDAAVARWERLTGKKAKLEKPKGKKGKG